MLTPKIQRPKSRKLALIRRREDAMAGQALALFPSFVKSTLEDRPRRGEWGGNDLSFGRLALTLALSPRRGKCRCTVTLCCETKGVWVEKLHSELRMVRQGEVHHYVTAKAGGEFKNP